MTNYEKKGGLVARGWKFIKDIFFEARDKARDDIANNAADSERIHGIVVMVDALMEVKIDDEKIISLLYKYWKMPYDDAKNEVRYIKTTVRPAKMLEFYLESEGYSNNEISDYMREKRVRFTLRHNHDLWKLTPEKLKSKFDSEK